jgi:hypothetical protein
MEEPELLLKQAVREMEEELDRDEQRAKLLALELKQIAGRQNDRVCLLPSPFPR